MESLAAAELDCVKAVSCVPSPAPSVPFCAGVAVSTASPVGVAVSWATLVGATTMASATSTTSTAYR